MPLLLPHERTHDKHCGRQGTPRVHPRVSLVDMDRHALYSSGDICVHPRVSYFQVDMDHATGTTGAAAATRTKKGHAFVRQGIVSVHSRISYIGDMDHAAGITDAVAATRTNTGHARWLLGGVLGTSPGFVGWHGSGTRLWS